MRARILRWSCVIATALAVVAGSASATSLNGRITLTERKKPLRQVEDVVVYFRPEVAVAPPVPEEALVMSTFRKRFVPGVLPVPVGASVRFPNNDPILHNAFSVSGDNQFDVGLYGEGDGEAITFEHPGLVKVFCNVHQAMVGHILVLDTPYYVAPAADGRFALNELPDGAGKLYVWHQRARKPLILDLELPVDEDLELDLTLTKRRVPNHKNKHGKSYRKDRRNRY